MDAKLYEMYLHPACIESKLIWHVYYVSPPKHSKIHLPTSWRYAVPAHSLYLHRIWTEPLQIPCSIDPRIRQDQVTDS